MIVRLCFLTIKYCVNITYLNKPNTKVAVIGSLHRLSLYLSEILHCFILPL
jgi:hypothetical protein